MNMVFAPRAMVDHAMKWARGRGLSRTSPIHGAEEFRIPTDFSFSQVDLERTTTTASSSVEVEAL